MKRKMEQMIAEANKKKEPESAPMMREKNND